MAEVFEAEEVWKPDKVKEAKARRARRYCPWPCLLLMGLPASRQASYGTTSTEHPSVAELFADLGKFYAGGRVSRNPSRALLEHIAYHMAPIQTSSSMSCNFPVRDPSTREFHGLDLAE